MKALVVCQCNLNRSPTVAKIIQKRHPKWKVRSAGVLYGYPYLIDASLLKWSDVIYVNKEFGGAKLGSRKENYPHLYNNEVKEK